MSEELREKLEGSADFHGRGGARSKIAVPGIGRIRNQTGGAAGGKSPVSGKGIEKNGAKMVEKKNVKTNRRKSSD